jgi:two-component system, cell cycle response regulator DivK
MAGELILIVEDNEKNRKLERDILQFHGYRTVEAETAEEGPRLAQATPPALVLMDIQPPGMNGIEVLHHLRADPRTRAIPVIAVTAAVMDRDRQKIMAAGQDLVLELRSVEERPDRASEAVDGLVRLNPDVIVAVSAPVIHRGACCEEPIAGDIRVVHIRRGRRTDER